VTPHADTGRERRANGKGDTYRLPDPKHRARCTEVGHTAPDRWGKCLRCAERIVPQEERA
jgi:hypothetical protein